ncbi:response regulator [Oceanibaculum pacificum]|nr:response regulator [Oceanibaculum pacificum]
MMGAYNFERMTVLVVDDNRHMRVLVRTILESLGCRNIVEGKHGQDAMEKMTHYRIDLVIVDWNMEPMDGIQFSRWVRNSADSPDPFTPIIMLTGHTEKEKVLGSRDAGVTEFMAKPVTARALYTRIVSIIETPRPFIRTEHYFGPDRRRQILPYPGEDRRVTTPTPAKAAAPKSSTTQLTKEKLDALQKAQARMKTMSNR